MRRLVVATIAVTALTTAGLALAATPRRQAVVDSTVRFLQESQGTSGGFANPGQSPDHLISSWVAMALGGAGINPQDQDRCGVDAYTYLLDTYRSGFEEELAWPQVATTAFEREALMVDSSGTDLHAFAGYDLAAEILGRRRPDGAFPYVEGGAKSESNDTIFAILALSPLHEPGVEAMLGEAAEWVVAAQDSDGGWYYSGKSPLSEVDMTGAALEALVAAGPPPGEAAFAAYERSIAAGLSYLHEAQLPDGGFPAVPGREAESNVASTAWAVQGIWATGGNPENWLVGGREPLDYMESMQQPDGHIRWRASSDMNGIWMTSYVTPAFAGEALPIPAAARSSLNASHGEASACVEGTAAEEGQGKHEDPNGVLNNGGGHGAPAFSRPKPQSKGETPGGARIVQGEGLEATDQSENRRGDNLHQPRGTEKAEPTQPSEADQEAAAVSATVSGASVPPPPPPTDGEAGGGGNEGKGQGERGAPLPVRGTPHGGATPTREVVSGVVVGSPDGTEDGELVFGAPGLRSAGAGGDGGLGAAIAIGVGALLAAGLGVGWEQRRGRLA
jgi:Prenyltransferase and squalene oxidase repeat